LDILAYAKNVGLNIVFHTNGLLITDEIANKLASLVSRVSLTMDGSTSEILMKMRKNIFIGKQTLHLVDIFHACDIPVSIKTLVSRINRDDIVNIGEILENLPISYWTLLEFVPLNRGELYKEKFFIKNNEFIEITDKIQGLYKNTQIRPIQYSKKTEGYCFITID
jgi:MoaA/NifB/PqqE/SkfB family radical SAM enzyme